MLMLNEIYMELQKPKLKAIDAPTLETARYKGQNPLTVDKTQPTVGN